MNLEIQVQLDYTFEQPCDVLVQIEAAKLPGQMVRQAHIAAPAAEYFARVPAQDGMGERIWIRAEGQLIVDYSAQVELSRQTADLASLAIIAPHQLPGEAVPYLIPSRYCQSNQMATFVTEEFGAIEGGAKVAAMRDWVAAHLSYVPGSSDANTTAVDTFVARQGICRDYAHLVVTLARAADIPARIASVYAPGVTPPDFHAVAEVFLGGSWHLVDATGMASAADIAIIGIGRDIGDVAFLTAFGPLEMNGQSVTVREV